MEKKNRIVFRSSLIILIIFITLGILLMYFPLRTLRKNTIQSLNRQHEILARQTAVIIREQFNYYHSLIHHMEEDPNIIHMNEIGKKRFKNFYESYHENLRAITRIDKKGILTYTYPYVRSAIGKDVSSQPHNARIVQEQRPIVSDLIRVVQGYISVVFAIPQFNSKGDYQGTLSVLVPFDIISQRLLENIELEEGSQAWLLTKNGDILYSSHEGHTGKNIFDVHRNDPEIIAMASDMINFGKGEMVIQDKYQGEDSKFYVIYYPIDLPLNHWFLAIATPEKVALRGIRNFTIWWILIFIVLIGILLIFVIRAVEKYIITMEEKKRMETEHKLRETESLLSRFLNNAPIPIVMTASDGTIEYINRHFEHQYGYTMAEIDHIKQWMDLAYPDPESRQWAKKFWDTDLKQVLREKQSFTTREKSLRSKDGTLKDIIITFTGIEDRVVISLDDRTIYNSLKNKEQELLFKKARARKMEAIGLMAGGVAHDLNNILSGIVSYPELLLLQLPKNSELRKPIEIIQKSGIRAAQVVSDLLTVARGVASPRKNTWINDVIREYLISPEYEMIRDQYPGIQVEIMLITDDDPKYIMASKVHIKKSLMNLVSNSAEAIGEEGVIRISTDIYQMDEQESAELKVRSGPFVLLTVEDNGPGISQQDREHIFEPFYTRKKMGKSGTGLGLSIVWNTIQDHEGAVKVYSDEGGTRFEIYLPVAHEERVMVRKSIETKNLQGRGQKILVVDDEAQQLEITSQILKQLGYEPYQAESGERALKLLEDVDMELILLDMIMGTGMNGRETYEKIIKTHPGQKAIIVSGYAHNKEVDAVLQLGANAYVAKPYSIQQLAQVIKEVLED